MTPTDFRACSWLNPLRALPLNERGRLHVRLVVWPAGLAPAAAHALAVACVACDAHAGDAAQRAVGDATGAAGYVMR